MTIKLSIIINNKNDKSKLHEGVETIYRLSFNSGLREAKGEYILFLDYHNKVERKDLEKLYNKAKHSNSDIVMGCAFRADIGERCEHKGLFKGVLNNTNIKETPNLIYDTMLSNKLFRRKFLIKNKLKLLEGNKYAEQLFITKTYLLAKSITVIPDTVCQLNYRGGIKEEVNIDDILYKDDILQKEVFYIAKEYFSSINENDFKKLKASDRLKYYLLKKGMLKEFLYVLRYYKEWYIFAACKIDGKVYADLPYFLDSKYNIPKYIYDITDEIQARCRLEEVKCVRGKLFIKGLAFIDFLDMLEENNVHKTLIFRNRSSKEEFKYKLNNINREKDILNTGDGLYYYILAGFKNEIDISTIENNIFREKNWEVFISITIDKIQKETYLGGALELFKEKCKR